jgi:multidrug efflux pump subunit AcrA (membrane-fusion protein)
LILADGSTYPHEGTFYFADRQVNESTGAIRFAGLFPNPGNILRPGGYGKVRAVIRVQQGALLVPQRAVSELQGGYQVAIGGWGKQSKHSHGHSRRPSRQRVGGLRMD